MPLKYTDEQGRAGEGKEGETFTVEQAIEKVGFGWLQLRIYVISKMVVATDAIEVMLLSLMGPVVQCEWALHEGQVAFISTAVFFGMAVASPPMGLLADHFGRRTSLIYSTLWTAYFGLLTTFSPSYVWLLLLRGLVGVGMGGIPQGYAMVAEYVPSKFRGKMIVCAEIFWAAGALFEILLAAVVTPLLGWRWLFALSSLPVFISFVSLHFIPESARFLVAAGRREEAMAILHRTALVNRTPLPPGTLVRSPKVPVGNLKEVLGPEYRRTTLLLWPVFFVASFAYYGIVLASPLLFSSSQSSADDQCVSNCHALDSDGYISMATSTMGEFAGLFVSFVLIDRIGRRWTGVVLCTIASLFLFLLQIPASQLWKTVFVFAVRGATLTFFNLIYIYTVEVYPTTTRALGLGICTSWTRFASMITPFLAQMLMVFSVPLTVTIYGAVCLLGAVLMFLLPIETMGRPMMQNVSYTAPDTSEQHPIIEDIRD